MNTSGAKAAATAGTTPPLPTSAPSEQIPTGSSQPAMPVGASPASMPGMPPPPVPPSLSMPPTPVAPVGAPEQPSSLPPMSGMPSMDSTAEQALSSTPARPVSEGNTFSFSGTAHQRPTAPAVPGATPAATTTKKKSKISLPVLIVLGLVFIIVWGLFWAIIFGFIKR